MKKNKIKNCFRKILFASLLLMATNLFGQRGIDEIISDSALIETFVPLNDEIVKIKRDFNNGNKEDALICLAKYFSNKMSERYFFDWKNFHARLNYYSDKYKEKINEHRKRANEHLTLFDSDSKWELPLVGKNGTEITPYQLRHLARQHKSVDIAFLFYLSGEKSEYIEYLIGQVNSLAKSYYEGNYDKKGNAVFESFRAGYRIYNWLFIYNSLLASEKFDWRSQIDYIKTFYYHSKELEKETKKFRFGNHQTKGLVALAITSILFPEFEDSKKNLDRAFALLTEHLMKEVGFDGFQFERSVHYHIGDIDNFFYVYQLAKINRITIPKEFSTKFQTMFEALVKIAMPNNKLPVLQDDTDSPWAEMNNMGSAMTIGAILFDDPSYKYFANSNLSAKHFWLFRNDDINKYKFLETKKPVYGSTVLKDAGYYSMRNGWNDNSNYMIISDGISKMKPDHQHGDMLGLYAYANENIILPNYQCRYFLEDYEYFKNSFVKNVAMVDSIPQGQDWKGNSGGSGFGKWMSLPEPKVIHWQNNEDYSLFIGSHNGYEKNGISYSRMVLFIKDGFYIVKDYFKNNSGGTHNYQQVWQGNYSSENKNRLIRATFQNGSGLDIYQLINKEYSLTKSDVRGKGSAIISSKSDEDFSFATLIYPFANFDNRLIVNEQNELEKLGNWKNYKNHFKSDEIAITANNILINESTSVNIGLSTLQFNDVEISFLNEVDILTRSTKDYLEIISLSSSTQQIKFSSEVKFIENETGVNSYNLNAGEIIKVKR